MLLKVTIYSLEEREASMHALALTLPNVQLCLYRYIMVVKVSDPSGEAWLSVFNEPAEKIMGCSADELDRVKTEVTTSESTTSKIRCLFSIHGSVILFPC